MGRNGLYCRPPEGIDSRQIASRMSMTFTTMSAKAPADDHYPELLFDHGIMLRVQVQSTEKRLYLRVLPNWNNFLNMITWILDFLVVFLAST